MSESIGGSGKGMKLHTKILIGLLVGATLGVMANVTLGGTHPTVEAINKYVAGPVGVEWVPASARWIHEGAD